MRRRDLLAGAVAIPALAAQQYTSRTRGLPRLTIQDVKVIATSGGHGYQWVFLKLITSEPGLYGLGSASNVNAAYSVISLIEKHYAPFWVGKDPDRIEDLWQSTNVHAYWRNSMIHNPLIPLTLNSLPTTANLSPPFPENIQECKKE